MKNIYPNRLAFAGYGLLIGAGIALLLAFLYRVRYPVWNTPRATV
jgi:hypothetical protein